MCMVFMIVSDYHKHHSRVSRISEGSTFSMMKTTNAKVIGSSSLAC